MILIVWGLMSLPVAFYYTTPNQFQGRRNSSSAINVEESDSDAGNVTDDICSNKYTGTHCLSSLEFFAACESPDSEVPSVYVGDTITDQAMAEADIGDLLYALDLLIQPSDECRDAVVPFLCLYTFGMCGMNNDDYRPSAAECIEIRDSICESEWKKAKGLLEEFNQPPLPDCSTLGDEGLDCDRISLNESKSECTIQCHQHFYCDNNFCKPRCDRFREYSESYIALSDALTITAGCAGLLCGIAVVVIFLLRRKTLMKFPTVLVFYSTFSLLFVEFIVLVSFMDRSELFCKRTDLVQSLVNPTAFCKLGGVLQTYFAIQVTLWWLFNILALYWKIQFPFHARYYDTTKRTEYIHVACILVGLLLPIFTPVALSVEGGFTMTRFPPIVCIGRNADANFYTVVFPITIMYAIGITFMLLIFWRIRRHMSNHQNTSRRINISFSAAERKIFIVLLYYTFSVALQLTTFSLALRFINHDINAITTYFTCQRSGEDSSCSLNTRQNPFWSLFALIVFLLLPAINLFFALRLSDLKLMCSLCLGLRKRVTLQQSSAGSSSLPSSKQTEETV
jgi:hypothetical protein